MNIAIYIIAALSSYLISALNPAIILSKLIYHKDIRKEGSGNPGFTNFKRVFGNKYAWFVFFLDIAKALILELIFGYLFEKYTGQRLFGIAYTGLFASLGHAYPIWYKFNGGKAFLVAVTTIFMVNWKAGLIASALLILLLFTTKYMSLATIIALLLSSLSLFFFCDDYLTIGIMIFISLFVTYRHKTNIKNLINGSERSFSLKSSKKDLSEENKSSEVIIEK